MCVLQFNFISGPGPDCSRIQGQAHRSLEDQMNHNNLTSQAGHVVSDPDAPAYDTCARCGRPIILRDGRESPC